MFTQKQGATEFFLEHPDAAGQGRLRHVARLRGMREVGRLASGQKVFDLCELH